MFKEVEGMEELNGGEPVKIISCRSFDFTIELDTRGFKAYTKQGIVENIKASRQVQFTSLEENVRNPISSKLQRVADSMPEGRSL